MKHYVHTIFYHSSGLTRNWMFNESIYCVLYLQILQFYLIRHIHVLQTSLLVTVSIHNQLRPYLSLDQGCLSQSYAMRRTTSQPVVGATN